MDPSGSREARATTEGARWAGNADLPLAGLPRDPQFIANRLGNGPDERRSYRAGSLSPPAMIWRKDMVARQRPVTGARGRVLADRNSEVRLKR
jgi:hypothetical protein